MAHEDRWISAREVAAMMGWHIRRVQRRYSHLEVALDLIFGPAMYRRAIGQQD
jgi:hypothetical protein